MSILPSRHPTGTVTFLFTDIEGSTVLWAQHPHPNETIRFDDGLDENPPYCARPVVLTTGSAIDSRKPPVAAMHSENKASVARVARKWK